MRFYQGSERTLRLENRAQLGHLHTVHAFYLDTVRRAYEPTSSVDRDTSFRVCRTYK